MDILSAQYVNSDLTEELVGIRVEYSDGKKTCVPINPNLGEYQKIMELVEAGELTIADAAPDA